MKTYLIAGLKVNFDISGRYKPRFDKYETEYTADPDATINISFEQCERYVKKFPELDMETAYYILSGFLFYRFLLSRNGFMLHSSAVTADGNVYLFSGQSGIGKSTHTVMWQELLGERSFIVNDDKPAILIRKDGVYACGTPWSGKHDLNRNICLPVKGICFISRGEKNEITPLDKKTAIVHIVNQCTKNFDSEQWEIILSMIDSVVSSVPVYKLKCIKDLSAARLSIKTMTGETV